MLAVAVVGGLIYRYYEGIQDRNRVERLVEGEAKIEPYEIQMLRTANGYDLETYKEAIQSLRRESLSWSSVLPYAALVDIISSSLKQQQKPLKLGYLLDRLVLGQVLRAAGSSAGSFSEHPLPLPFLVCLLSLPMESDVHSRLEGLYHAVTVLNEEAEEVRREQLVELVQALVDSDQVPSEKQIEESGVKYPIHLYRRRSADGMVAAYEEKSLKLPKDDKVSSTPYPLIAMYQSAPLPPMCLTIHMILTEGAVERGRVHRLHDQPVPLRLGVLLPRAGVSEHEEGCAGETGWDIVGI